MQLDNIIEICVAIDIAILGIAYPLIVDKISAIGDKYNSNYLSTLFNKEFPHNIIALRLFRFRRDVSFFKLILIITITCFILLILNVEPPFGWDNWLINNSAKSVVFLSTLALTVFFFFWLDKVILYNGKSTSLLQHIINQYKTVRAKSIPDENYWLKTINEFTYYAIRSQDEHLQKTLLEFYFEEFITIRRNHVKEKPLVYPQDLYFLVHKLNIELANSNKNRLAAIEHRAISGIWLLGEDFDEIEISEDTYYWLWRNLFVIFDNDKFIKMYWSTVNQHFDFKLRHPDYIYGQDGISNQPEIDKRDSERFQFLEFHYALGGLLLYRQQYKTLNYILNYSQSLPPKYVLLANDMTEIFTWFEEFRNEYRNRKNPIDIKYTFPELDNLGNRRQVNYWICCYIVVLFIRLYTLQKYYTFQDHTGMPRLPEDLVELNNWLETVNFFTKCLQDVLANKNLLDVVELSKIIEIKGDDFIPFLDSIKVAINKKIAHKKLSAEIVPEKVDALIDSSRDILVNAFDKYNNIFIDSKTKNLETDLKLSVTGHQTLMPKSAFTEGEIPHMFYESVVAEQIVRNSINKFIPNSFLLARTRRYHLNKENLIIGLNKLINKRKDLIVIGVRLDYELSELLEKSKIEVTKIPASEQSLQNLLFVLPQKDLPSLIFDDISDKEIDKHKLEFIDEKRKIRASVIDINLPENREIKESWQTKDDPDTLELKVQVTIAFQGIIVWGNSRDVVQISIASPFKEQGIQNDIKDILPF